MRVETTIRFFLIIAIISLQIQIWYSQEGLAGFFKLRNQQEKTLRAINKLEQSNQTLTGEIINLKQNTNVIEKYIRYELGAIKPGETFFLINQQP